MKTVYIAKANIPSYAANSVHVMKISEAFSDICNDFLLIVPRPAGGKKDIDSSFAFYGVKTYNIETVNVASKGLRNRYGFAIKSIWKARRAERIITRDPLVAFLAVILRKKTVLDLHGDLAHLCGRAYRMIKWKWFRDSKYLTITMTTKGLLEFYQGKYNFPSDRAFILPNGYTPGEFEKVAKKDILNQDELDIGYCGGFVKGKGLSMIYQLAPKDKRFHYNLFGGTKEDAEKEMGGGFPDNVNFGGYIPNAKVPEVLCRQDILLLPNQREQRCKNEDIGKITSPIKMFEYMISGRVIVASDIPVIREILDESNCYMVSPDDSEEWLETIHYISEHREEAKDKAKKAREDARKYTWENRAKRIIELSER